MYSWSGRGHQCYFSTKIFGRVVPEGILSHMALFEGFRRRSQERLQAEYAGYQQAAGALDAAIADGKNAEARLNYTRARSTELMPHIRKEAELEIRRELATTQLDSAKRRLDHLQKMGRLKAELRKKVEQLAARSGGLMPAEETSDQEELAAATEELKELESAHAQVTEELRRVREHIAERERALRQQFGIEGNEQ